MQFIASDDWNLLFGVSNRPANLRLKLKVEWESIDKSIPLTHLRVDNTRWPWLKDLKQTSRDLFNTIQVGKFITR